MIPIVHVEWEDACGDDPWTKIADLDQEPRRVETVGFLVRQTDRAITVASTKSDEDICCFMVIPRGMIIKISEVTVGREMQAGLRDNE